MPWGGRLASKLTGLEVVAILEFCRSEGSRQGYNDAHSDRIDSGLKGPFHPELLGGFPAQVWEASYFEGITEFRDSQAVDEDPEGVDYQDSIPY